MSDSWGYNRTQSPASRKARRLKNLRIEEVSTVDRGAAPGARVLLRKRIDDNDAASLEDQITRVMQENGITRQQAMDYLRRNNAGTALRDERTEKMQTEMSALTICKRAQDMANAGRLSQFALNELMRHVADTHFAGNMAKMLATDSMGRPTNQFGAIFLAPRSARASAAENAELMKREGYDVFKDKPLNHLAPPNPDDVAADNDEDEEDDGAKRAEKTADAIKRYTAAGLSYDAAVTKVLREQRGW
jgi:hypothetical protein